MSSSIQTPSVYVHPYTNTAPLISSIEKLQINLKKLDNEHSEHSKKISDLKQEFGSNIIEIEALRDYMVSYKKIWKKLYQDIPCELSSEVYKHYLKQYEYTKQLKDNYLSQLKNYEKIKPEYITNRQKIINQLLLETEGLYCTEFI